MHVRYQRRVHVHGVRVGIVAVANEHQHVGRPAYNERDKNHEDHPTLLQYRLVNLRLRFGAALLQASLRLVDGAKDAAVAKKHDNDGEEQADDDEEEDVGVAAGSVPQTLVALVVEVVPTPAEMTRQVDGDPGRPNEHAHGDAAPAGVHAVVGVLVTHVHVAVDADTADAQERHAAADDADARQSVTQASVLVEEPPAVQHAYNTDNQCPARSISATEIIKSRTFY